MRKRTLAIGAILLGVGGTCAATGVALVPVGLTLGPCLRDWTSPSSYGRRVSPLATVDIPVGDGQLRVCYGRPAARGREVFGGLVPWDEPWRLGANEPTRLYLNRAATIAGVRLEPGRYAITATPRRKHWEIAIRGSVSQWGNDFSPPVLGTGAALVEALAEPVETLTVRPLPADDGTMRLAVEWERTRALLEVRPEP